MRKSLFVILLTGLSLLSCSKYGGDTPPPKTPHMIVKFVSETGANVLDSLFDEGVITGDVDEVFTVTWRRQFYGDTVHPEVLLLPTGDDHTDSYLSLGWLDPNITQGAKDTDGNYLIDSRPWSYTDVYIIDIVSPLVFGDDAPRTILWQQNVEGYSVKSFSLDIGGTASIDDVIVLVQDSDFQYLQFIVRKMPQSD